METEDQCESLFESDPDLKKYGEELKKKIEVPINPTAFADLLLKYKERLDTNRPRPGNWAFWPVREGGRYIAIGSAVLDVEQGKEPSGEKRAFMLEHLEKTGRLELRDYLCFRRDHRRYGDDDPDKEKRPSKFDVEDKVKKGTKFDRSRFFALCVILDCSPAALLDTDALKDRPKTTPCARITVQPLPESKQSCIGYALKPHWILTSRRALFAAGSTAPAEAIEVTWPCSGVPATVLTGAAVKWSSAEHDIALLRCDAIPDDAPSAWGMISNHPPKSGTPVQSPISAAQPDAAGVGHIAYASGRLAKHGSAAAVVPIDDFEGDDADVDLSTSSGAPVFSDGALVGVLRPDCRTGTASTSCVSLLAAALGAQGDLPDQPCLRDIPGFRDAPHKERLWKVFRAEVLKRMNESDSLYRCIQDASGQSLAPGPLADWLYDSGDDVWNYLVSVLPCLKRSSAAVARDVETLATLAQGWFSLIAAELSDLPALDSPDARLSAAASEVMVNRPRRAHLESQVAAASARGADFVLVKETVRDDAGAVSTRPALKSKHDASPGNLTGLDDQLALDDAIASVARKTMPGPDAYRDSVAIRATTAAKREPKDLPDDADAWYGELCKYLALYRAAHDRHLYVWAPAEWPEEERAGLRALADKLPGLLAFDVACEPSLKLPFCLVALHSLIIDCKTDPSANSP